MTVIGHSSTISLLEQTYYYDARKVDPFLLKHHFIALPFMKLILVKCAI